MTARFVTATIFAATLIPTHLFAQANPQNVDALFEAMALPEMLAIMQAEGLDYGDQIAEDLFPGRASEDWDVSVAGIYDIDMMTQTVRSGLGEALGDADVDAMVAFFTSDLGKSIVELEVSAREALMDEDVEAASKDIAAIALADETPRTVLITEFIETNDLLETNVVGAMNANYAFYIGLMNGGGMGQGLSEDEILADVWSQEAEIRQNTAEWIYSYLLMAYQPLSDADIEAYIAFSATAPGQDLNTALFVAFDEMFEGISEALGLAASTYMVGQDL